MTPKPKQRQVESKHWPMAVVGVLLVVPTSQITFQIIEPSNEQAAAVITTLLQFSGLALLVIATVRKIKETRASKKNLVAEGLPYFLATGAVLVLLSIVVVAIFSEVSNNKELQTCETELKEKQNYYEQYPSDQTLLVAKAQELKCLKLETSE